MKAMLTERIITRNAGDCRHPRTRAQSPASTLAELGIS